MSNRTLLYLTILVLVGMGVLFILNIQNILSGQSGSQNYLKYNEVRGIAIKHQGLLYTLNFDQQNELIDIINLSVRITDINPGTRQEAPIEAIIVYLFGGKPDLMLKPVAYVMDQDLIYSMPDWNPNGYMMEMSHGQLQRLLSQAYDH